MMAIDTATTKGRRVLPDLGTYAVIAGLLGLLAGPFLVADPTLRYLVLAADIVALALGSWSVWGAVRQFARLDMGIAAILTGGVSLYLWMIAVTGSSPPGGT